LWANPIIEITYATTDTKTKVGSTVHVDLTDPDITRGLQNPAGPAPAHSRERHDTLPVVVATASSVRFTLNDLFAHVVLDSDNSSGGSGGSSASDPASPPSGAAATALQLDPGKKINNTLFTGASDINITAAPDHLGETPAGTINGANTVFTTAATYKTGSLTVYVNGVRQKKTTHWTETSGTTFTMNQAPTTGDLVTVDYEAN
jgi:hypothetical protein